MSFLPVAADITNCSPPSLMDAASLSEIPPGGSLTWSTTSSVRRWESRGRSHDENAHRENDRSLVDHIVCGAHLPAVGADEDAQCAGCRVLDTRLSTLGLSRLVPNGR